MFALVYTNPSINAAAFHSHFCSYYIFIITYYYFGLDLCVYGIYISHLLSEYDTLSCACVMRCTNNMCVFISYVFPLRCHSHFICVNLSIIPLFYTSNRSRSVVRTDLFVCREGKKTGNCKMKLEHCERDEAPLAGLSICFSRCLCLSFIHVQFSFCTFSREYVQFQSIAYCTHTHTHTRGTLLISCHSLIYFSAKRKSRNDAIPSTA